MERSNSLLPATSVPCLPPEALSPFPLRLHSCPSTPSLSSSILQPLKLGSPHPHPTSLCSPLLPTSFCSLLPPIPYCSRTLVGSILILALALTWSQPILAPVAATWASYHSYWTSSGPCSVPQAAAEPVDMEQE